MNTHEQFSYIFNQDILNIGVNSKLSKPILIEAFTKSINEKKGLLHYLPYSNTKALSVGLRRAIKINKPNASAWPYYLLQLYFPKVKTNKATGISISPSENRKEYDKQYALVNKDKKRASSAKRRAQLLKALPTWADEKKILEIYLNCPTGYHVDHIIPLQGNIVCGLHIDTNLQYLKARENLAKSNKYISE